MGHNAGETKEMLALFLARGQMRSERRQSLLTVRLFPAFFSLIFDLWKWGC
jgi:hypothetical protein